MPATTISRGNILVNFLMGPTLTPVLVAQNTIAEQSFTVKGLATNDYVNVMCNVTQTTGVGIVNARVSAAETLTLAFSNVTGGGLTPVSGVYLISVDRAESLPLPTNGA